VEEVGVIGRVVGGEDCSIVCVVVWVVLVWMCGLVGDLLTC
jgi:hypothetical protein